MVPILIIVSIAALVILAPQLDEDTAGRSSGTSSPTATPVSRARFQREANILDDQCDSVEAVKDALVVATEDSDNDCNQLVWSTLAEIGFDKVDVAGALLSGEPVKRNGLQLKVWEATDGLVVAVEPF